MILLDTNVVSEFMRPGPNPLVRAWLSRQPVSEIFITSITEAELRYGLAILPAGKRREALIGTLRDMLAEDFHDRILPFDSAAAISYAELSAVRRQSGRPISQSDAQIAAIAGSRTAGLATRNVKDFEGCGIEIINPWVSSPLP